MTQREIKNGQRNSKMLLEEVYFWTDTIKDWHKLLNDDFNKDIIINGWKNLVIRNKIKLYAFVVMPNHVHAIWEMLSKNGKEMPYASFNKFTSHQFLEKLRIRSVSQLVHYQEFHDRERKHRFWQRDPLAVRMDSKDKVEQKIKSNGIWLISLKIINGLRQSFMKQVLMSLILLPTIVNVFNFSSGL